jgi:hypothetical protein
MTPPLTIMIRKFESSSKLRMLSISVTKSPPQTVQIIFPLPHKGLLLQMTGAAIVSSKKSLIEYWLTGLESARVQNAPLDAQISALPLRPEFDPGHCQQLSPRPIHPTNYQVHDYDTLLHLFCTQGNQIRQAKQKPTGAGV